LSINKEIKVAMSEEADLQEVVAAVKGSRKYGDTSEETIRQLAQEALRQHKRPKAAIKAVRKRLHSIMAPYLGDPDYEATALALDEAFADGDGPAVREICLGALASHLSTRERMPIMEAFYREIFQVTGKPERLLDIACALNPMAFPWMGLPVSVQYFAYDIHEPRIDFLNHYFRLQGLAPLARVQDIALKTPQEAADVALFLKEMPRFERNYPGSGRDLLLELPVRYLVVSFPTVSTHGGRSLVNRYRQFFSELVADVSWPVAELMFEGEMVFIAEKS
jgi:16S rRNA (guanine(1405)-N(7))-methyltransferase